MRRGTNSYSESMALYLLLNFVMGRSIDNPRVFGHYGFVINWMSGKLHIHNVNILLLAK